MSAPEDSANFTRGFRWERSAAAEGRPTLEEVVEASFDYRGDVTLGLEGGESVTGYVSNRELGERPHLQVFPQDGSPRRRIDLSAIHSLDFSGKDTASGKSWETWVAKWNEKKAAEARGEAVGEIGLFPEELD